jgi:uroporphyrinogen-III synthase
VMKDKKVKILSTKVLTWEQKAMVLHPKISLIEFPFIQIKPIHFEWPKTRANVWIFTSANAVEAVLNQVNDDQKEFPIVWCVGEKTKAKLEALNFKVKVYFNYAKQLNDYILKNFKNNIFIWFRGNVTTGHLTQNFNQNIHWSEVIVYENESNPTQISVPYDAVLFFSPSAVESFLQNNSLKGKVCFCIGETTLAKVSETASNNVILPKNPTIENVLLEVKKYYLLNN